MTRICTQAKADLEALQSKYKLVEQKTDQIAVIIQAETSENLADKLDLTASKCRQVLSLYQKYQQESLTAAETAKHFEAKLAESESAQTQLKADQRRVTEELEASHLALASLQAKHTQLLAESKLSQSSNE